MTQRSRVRLDKMKSILGFLMALTWQCHTHARILRAPVRAILGNRVLLLGASLSSELPACQTRSAEAGHMESCGFSGKPGWESGFLSPHHKQLQPGLWVYFWHPLCNFHLQVLDPVAHFKVCPSPGTEVGLGFLPESCLTMLSCSPTETQPGGEGNRLVATHGDFPTCSETAYVLVTYKQAKHLSSDLPKHNTLSFRCGS